MEPIIRMIFHFNNKMKVLNNILYLLSFEKCCSKQIFHSFVINYMNLLYDFFKLLYCTYIVHLSDICWSREIYLLCIIENNSVQINVMR